MSGSNNFLKEEKIHTRFLILFFCSTFICFSQIKTLTSQEHFIINEYLESLGNYSDDSLALILYQKSQEFIEADSLVIANQILFHSIEIAQQQNDTMIIGLGKIRQGEVFNKLLKYRNSFQSYNDAYDISLECHDTVLMIQAMKGIERYYYQLELIDSAITYCTAAAEINKLQNNYAELSGNYGRLYAYQRYTTGDVLLNTFMLDGLMDSSLSAAIKSKNLNLLCHKITDIGLITYDTDIEKAFQYMQVARDSARKIPAPSKELVYALTKSSIICIRSKLTRQARIFLDEALPLAEKLNYTSQLTHINFLIGEMLYTEDSISQAIPYYYKAINYAEKYRHKYYLPFIYSSLFKLYLSNNDLDSSFKFQQKYMEIFRKNHNRDMNIQIARLSAKYRVEQKIEAIDDLTIINKQRKIIIRDQQLFIIILILGIIAVVVVFSLLYNQFKKIKKAHLKLSQNAIELNQKNREIADLRKKRDYKREVVYNELKTKLDDLFENKKFYLKKELTLAKTARILKTNTSYLSGLINKYYDCNFNQFVNNYRIQNACELLNNRNMDIYSIEGIAEMAGFKSKSVFNQVFRESTGVHPSDFRNSIISSD